MSTPSAVGFRDGTSVPGGKVPQLEALVRAVLLDGAAESEARKDEEAWRAATRAVAFFDDDERNVDVARRAGFAGATLVERDVGFTRESWEGRLGEAVGMRGLDVPGFRSGSLTGS